MYVQNYGIEFVAVGYIATASDAGVSYEYSSFFLSHNAKSLASAAYEAYASASADERGAVERMTEKSIYCAYGVKESRPNGESVFAVGERTYASYEELAQAKPIALGVGSSTVSLAEGDGLEIEVFFMAGGEKISSVKGMELRYTSADSGIAEFSGGVLTGIATGTTTVTATAGKYSVSIDVTVTAGPVVLEGMRDDYSGCFDITAQADGSTAVSWPKAGTSKAQWAKTEAFVSDYRSEYKYLKLTFITEKAHKIGIFYSPAKWNTTETPLKTHTDVPAGTTVWYIEMPADMPESFELRYFFDTALANDTGALQVKTEFIQNAPLSIGTLTPSTGFTVTEIENGYNVTWVESPKSDYVHLTVTGWKEEYAYFNFTVTNNGESEMQIGVWADGYSNCLHANTKLAAGETRVFKVAMKNVNETINLRFFIDYTIARAGDINITDISFSEAQPSA